jgi:hypothetical protein
LSKIITNIRRKGRGIFLIGYTLVSSTVLNVSYYDDYAFMGANGIPAFTDANFKYDAKLVTTPVIRQVPNPFDRYPDSQTGRRSTPSYLCSVMSSITQED